MRAFRLLALLGLSAASIVAVTSFGCAQGLDPSPPSGGAGGSGVGGAGGGGLVTSTGANAGGAASVAASTAASSSSTAVSSSTVAASSSSVAASSSSVAASSSSVASSGSGGVNMDLIDDMEDGNGSIIMQGGRVGAWYTYNDMSAGGSQVPPMGSAFLPDVIPGGGQNGSTRAAHTSGSGFSSWGAGMGFDLDNDGVTPKKTYNVSGFTGIQFWAKGSPTVRLKVLVAATVAAADGGTCQSMCGDSHGVKVALTQSWQLYAIPFSSLTQEGWGAPTVFDPTAVLAVQWATGANMAFDYWIDDVAFY